MLRQRGYPAPSHDVIGSTPAGSYVIQQYLPGRPTHCFTAGQLPMLLRLSSLQVGAAPAAALPDADWPEPVITPVMEGGDGYCELTSLRQHSTETRELLQTLQQLAAAGLSATYRTTDIVHYDWGPGNVLTDGDTVTGVVDWEAVCAGDRSFDLATALFYSADDALLWQALWASLLALVPAVVVAANLAHLILRQVDWSLRHHPAAVAAAWLEHARVMLTDIRERIAL